MNEKKTMKKRLPEEQCKVVARATGLMLEDLMSELLMKMRRFIYIRVNSITSFKFFFLKIENSERLTYRSI